MSSTIAIGVGGRFHSDQMLQALLAGGFHPALYSSFPKQTFAASIAKNVKSFPVAEAVFRLGRLFGNAESGDSLKRRAFGLWLAERVERSTNLDLLWVWSSFALEAFRARAAKRQWLMRDSSHIGLQMEILQTEAERWGTEFELPNSLVERECEEYALADKVIVLSEFARRSFLERGFSPERLEVLSLGVDTQRFRPKLGAHRHGPLRVVYFGSLSFRKGTHYLLEACKGFAPSALQLTLIGNIDPEFAPMFGRYSGFSYQKAVPQHLLAELIADHEVFLFPTIEDGFGQTLVQAMASGLVPVTTSHCGAADWVEEGRSGFVVPPFNAPALSEKLEWLVQNSSQRRAMAEAAVVRAREASWERYAARVLALLPSDLRLTSHL